MSLAILSTSAEHLQTLAVDVVARIPALPFDHLYLLIIMKLAFWYGLAFTPAKSPLRPYLVAIIAITGLVSLRSPRIYWVPGAVACDWIVGVIIHASNFLLIARRVPPPEATTFSSKALWGLNGIVAGRWNVPHPPKFSDNDPNYVPTRTKLFLQRFVDFAICFTIAAKLEKTHIPGFSYRDPGGFFSRLDEVTGHELLLRLFLMIKGSMIPYLGLRACHCFSTCVALLFGSPPEAWPPLFGSITEAYTVRRYYSHFWHHAMRRALTAHGSLLTYYVIWAVTLSRPKSLRFPVARYLTTVFTFLASAAMHVATCPRMELHMIKPELWLHIGTAVAIMFEDLVIKSYQQVWQWMNRGSLKLKQAKQYTKAIETSACATGSTRNKTVASRRHKRTKSNAISEKSSVEIVDDLKTHHQPSVLWRGLGYVWATAFWTWSVSGLMFSLYNS